MWEDNLIRIARPQPLPLKGSFTLTISYGVITDSNGLYYMRARYYNPDIKRFINQDIKVGDISNGQGLNRYAYCEGNPISMVDPFGLCGENAQDQSKLSKFLAELHICLDILGFVFDGADVLNTIIYALEGKTDEALWCGLAVIPIVGSFIAGAVKAGKAFKAIKNTNKLVGVVTDSSKLLTKTDDVADTTGDIMQALTKGGDTPQKLANEVASDANAKVVKTLETGSDATDAKKAVDSLESVTSSNGVKVKTTADEVVEEVVGGGRYSAFGEMSDADGIRYRDWNYEKIYEMSIHNPNSNYMMLGKYFDGTIESGSYVAKAELTGDTYFSLGQKWDDITQAYGLSDKEMFNLFNTRALDDAVAQGKTIRFSQNPLDWGGTALGDEWSYLQHNHGYTDLIEMGGYWYGIK